MQKNRDSGLAVRTVTWPELAICSLGMANGTFLKVLQTWSRNEQGLKSAQENRSAQLTSPYSQYTPAEFPRLKDNRPKERIKAWGRCEVNIWWKQSLISGMVLCGWTWGHWGREALGFSEQHHYTWCFQNTWASAILIDATCPSGGT